MTLDGEDKRQKIKEKTKIKKEKGQEKERERNKLIFRGDKRNTVTGKRNEKLKREEGHCTEKN